MRDAAVGYQCPSCVAEGSRETRQTRTPYGGQRSASPALTSLGLVAANVGVWLAITATGGAASRLVDRLALLAAGRCEANRPGYIFPGVTEAGACRGTWVPGVVDGAWWQPVTSMFTHVEIWHIGFNMLALWFLGPQLELAVGRLRFLALYLISGLAGSAAVLWLAGDRVQTLGASGAVFGLIGALLVVTVKVGGNVSQIGMWLLLNGVLTFTIPHISWQGHLGGLVGGSLVAAILVWSPRPRRAAWQAAGLIGLAVLILAAIVLRLG